MTQVQCGMMAFPWPHEHIREGDQGKSRKRVLARDEKPGSIVCELSTHMREEKHTI